MPNKLQNMIFLIEKLQNMICYLKKVTKYDLSEGKYECWRKSCELYYGKELTIQGKELD